MDLAVTGINHNTAPVKIRERLSFSLKDLVDANRRLKEYAGLKEALILSTCNRVEVYTVRSDGTEDILPGIKSFFRDFHDVSPSSFGNRLYTYRAEETVRHIFKVASGLDSMVIGEAEILGQVKQAYQHAVRGGTTGKILNRLLQNTFKTAKKVRSETFISRGSVSVSSLAVKMAGEILDNLDDKKVLVIGAGEVSQQLVLYLKKNGTRSIVVANRTYEKASSLARELGAKTVRFESLRENLKEADIVITSTAAPHHIITKKDIQQLMPERRERPLLIIDLAVPRDVEEGAGSIDNVYLCDIDDIKKLVDKNLALRMEQADKCREIIDDSSGRFMKWLYSERKGREKQ